MDNKRYLLKVQNHDVFYNLVRTNRKTIGITVDINGEIKVSAPLRISEKQIIEVVNKKANWILNKLNQVQEMKKDMVQKQFINGEKFLYLGKEYVLKIEDQDTNEDRIIVYNNTITVYISNQLHGEYKKEGIKKVILKWYKECFSEIAAENIKKYSSQLKVTPSKVAIKDQKTIWGSCSTRGNINLNWRLVMAPMSIIDYVIVHELCHMKVMNHSKDFWNQVGLIIPDYIEKRNWLKLNGYLLKL